MKTKNKKTIIERLEDINADFTNSKSTYTDLFVKLFSSFSFINNIKKNFASLILWTIHDWYIFIPIIDSYSYRQFRNIYMCILNEMVSKQIFNSDNILDYEYYIVKLWGASTKYTENYKFKIDVNMNKSPFHIDESLIYNINNLSCIRCTMKEACTFEGMGLGKCSKTICCCQHSGIHICKNHYPYLFQNTFNKIELCDKYILNDGRITSNLYCLELINTNPNTVYYQSKLLDVNKNNISIFKYNFNIYYDKDNDNES